MFIVSSRARHAVGARDDHRRQDDVPMCAAPAAELDPADDAHDPASHGWHASSWALRSGLEVQEGDLDEWQSCRDALQRLIATAATAAVAPGACGAA